MRSTARYCVALGLGLAPILLSATTGLAQTELPPITVEGATLAAPKATRKSAGAPVAKETTAGAKDADAKDAEATEAGDGVPAATVGNSVTVITRKDLERLQVRQVADALRSLPGITVNRSGAYGNFTQVRIRGAEGNHTLVLIDGVEANSTTDGEFDFSNLSAEDIERIEVIRGPMSALYGANAVGGVISIVTRRGQGPLTLTLKTEAGSLGTRDLSAHLSAGSQWAHFALGTHWRSTDGFNISALGNETDGMLLQSFNLRGGVKLAEGLGLEVNLRYTDKKADRDGLDFVSPIQTVIDDASVQHDKVFVGGVLLRWDTLNKALTHQLHLKHNSSTLLDQDAVFGRFENIGERTGFSYLATYRFESPALWGLKHTLSGLIDWETEAFTPKSGDGITRERERLSFAGEWSGAFANQVFVTAGVRHDDNSVFSDFTTWRLSGAWVIKSMGLRPHASIGTAVKFPSMFEQFADIFFIIPNPNLLPEKSLGWDAGVEVTLSPKVALDITYFHADLTDKIRFTGMTYENVPGVSTRDGIEVALRTRLAAVLSATFAYTYLLAEGGDGLAELRRPRHGGRMDLAYVFAGGLGSANLGVIYNGTMIDNQFINPCCPPPLRVLLDDYWLVNASVSYKLQPGVELFGRVENLFDQRYEEVFSYQSAPITAFAGIKLTFGGPDGIGGSGKK